MRALKIISGIIISAVFLYLALRGVDAHALAEELERTQAIPVVAAVIAFLSAFLVRTARWKVVLGTTPDCPSFRKLISALFIGYGANAVLPLRAGEVVRGFAISRRSRTGFATALSSIVLERVVDGLTLLAVLAALLILRDFPDWVAGVAYGALALFGGGIAFLLVIYHLRGRATTAITGLVRRIGVRSTEGIERILARLVEGISLLSSPGGVVWTLILSFIIWTLEAITYWFVGLSLGLDLSIWAVLLTLVVINFGLTLPSSPGFIGTFEYAGVLALGVFGISHDEALGFTLVLHAMFIAVLVIAGLIFAWIDHGGIRTLAGRAAARADGRNRI